MGCEAGGEGDLKGSMKRIWHIFILRREGAGWRSLQHSQVRADASCKRALASQSASYCKTCSHVECTENTRRTFTFRVSSVRVTPGNRGRRFSRFHPGTGTRACCTFSVVVSNKEICWQGQSKQKWPLWKLTLPAWDNFNDLLVEATLLF